MTMMVNKDQVIVRLVTQLGHKDHKGRQEGMPGRVQLRIPDWTCTFPWSPRLFKRTAAKMGFSFSVFTANTKP